MRVAFAGTPDFAATVLRGLLDSDHEVGLVISQPDTPRGRGRKLAASPVTELARAEGLPLVQPARISEVTQEISRHDALVVAAYGQILRPDTLYATPSGAWNVHASLLPAYRGAAPIERAIMNGETTTGISIMKMDEGLDTGPVALKRPIDIPPNMTGGELAEALANLGAKAVVEVLNLLDQGSITLSEQDSFNATYAAKLTVGDRIVRWGEEVRTVHDLIRALSPHVGAQTFHPDVSGPIKLLRSRIFEGELHTLDAGEIYAANGCILVGCADGVLEVLELQMPGKRPLRAREFLVGNALSGSFLSG